MCFIFNDFYMGNSLDVTNLGSQWSLPFHLCLGQAAGSSQESTAGLTSLDAYEDGASLVSARKWLQAKIM